MNQKSSPPTRQVGPIRGTGETCNAAEAATRSTAELQVPKTWRELHPRPRRCERRNRSLHHRIGIGFVGERSRRAKPSSSQSRRAGLSRSKPATRRPLRSRLHGTMHAPDGFEPPLSSAKYPYSSPPTNVFRGTADTALVFQDEEIRVFTT